MPGAGMIGERHLCPIDAGKSRPTCQSSQVRNLARLLKVLKDPELAATALLAAFQQVPVMKRVASKRALLLSQLKSSLDQLRQTGWDNFKFNASIEMAQAVEDVFHILTGKQPANDSSLETKRQRCRTAQAKPGGEELLRWSDDAQMSAAASQKSKSRNDPPNDQEADFKANAHNLSKGPDQTPAQTTTTEMMTKASALVSDSESKSQIGNEQQEEIDVDTELALIDFWPNLHESVHLQIASRTTTTWGKKKIYEVYRLAGPTMPVCNFEQLRDKICREFLTVYDGSVGTTGFKRVRHGECRVFIAQHSNPTALWIQLSIGRPFDVNDEANRSISFGGQKKKKSANEFLAVILPESNLVALTASRAPSRSVFTPCVLSALETVLTCSVAGGYASGAAQRIQDLSGTEPFELLRDARRILASEAVGRHAHCAAVGASSDPITDIHRAATGSLLDRTWQQQNRIKTGEKHGRAVAELSSQIATQGACLMATTDAGACIDHSAHDQNERKRSRIGEFGEIGDCPRRQCVRWDWKGLTNAPQLCWNDSSFDNNQDLPKEDLFKCRVVLKGTDVFAGLQALMDAGLMKGPLPHYVRDAPMLGGKINVEHGVVVTRNCEK